MQRLVYRCWIQSSVSALYVSVCVTNSFLASTNITRCLIKMLKTPMKHGNSTHHSDVSIASDSTQHLYQHITFHKWMPTFFCCCFTSLWDHQRNEPSWCVSQKQCSAIHKEIVWHTLVGTFLYFLMKIRIFEEKKKCWKIHELEIEKKILSSTYEIQAISVFQMSYDQLRRSLRFK